MGLLKAKRPSAGDGEKRGRNAIVYNLGPFDTQGSATSAMLSFLRLLKQRYESILGHLPDEEDEARRQLFRRNLQTLAFAEAFLEKGEVTQAHPRHPSQIAVLGPTQVGKSSVINWLLDRQLAEVSPLAGYTVHPQGFAVGAEPGSLEWLGDYFRHYRRCARNELSADRYDCYLLEETEAVESRSPLAGTVLWDTPDFDSVDAEDYRPAVWRVAALADVAVLVLSKDKYADLSVWELMELLEPLGQPTVICLNKIDPPSQPALLASLREKWQATRRDSPPPVIAVPYLEEAEEQGLAAFRNERADLLTELDRAARGVRRDRHAVEARRLVDTHLQNWLAPVRAEHLLLAEWREMVDEAIGESLHLYQRDYLNHPHHYETFQRALAELLTLLEVPGIAGVLLTARKIVTWPVRQIIKLGQAAGRGSGLREGGETAILHQGMEHAFINIGETLLLKRGETPTEEAWWREMGMIFRDDKPTLARRFQAAVQDYLRDFQPEIDRTAHRLYDHLRQHPAVLNGLRATRVTTDAAALAMALHTGGIGIQDFIIAPATLSLTTMLAEGALGRFMDKAAAELKEKQMAAVERLFTHTLSSRLIRLPNSLDATRRFDIPPDTIEMALARMG